MFKLGFNYWLNPNETHPNTFFQNPRSDEGVPQSFPASPQTPPNCEFGIDLKKEKERKKKREEEIKRKKNEKKKEQEQEKKTEQEKRQSKKKRKRKRVLLNLIKRHWNSETTNTKRDCQL